MFEMADEYLAASSADRKQIRERVSRLLKVKYSVFKMVKEQEWLISDQSNFSLVRQLLSLLSIADCGREPSVQVAVTNLHGRCRHAEIDFAELLSEAAEYSSDIPKTPVNSPDLQYPPKAVSTREFFSSFEPFRRW